MTSLAYDSASAPAVLVGRIVDQSRHVTSLLTTASRSALDTSRRGGMGERGEEGRRWAEA
jgi:hypothetical protein